MLPRPARPARTLGGHAVRVLLVTAALLVAVLATGAPASAEPPGGAPSAPVVDEPGSVVPSPSDTPSETTTVPTTSEPPVSSTPPSEPSSTPPSTPSRTPSTTVAPTTVQEVPQQTIPVPSTTAPSSSAPATVTQNVIPVAQKKSTTARTALIAVSVIAIVGAAAILAYLLVGRMRSRR